MKAKELAEQLMKNPDFDVKFLFSEELPDDFFNLKSFKDIEIIDVGYSDQMIMLGGTENK